MNILIIEDDLILAEKISKVFKLTGNFNNIKTLNSYNAFLREYNIITSYDIILVDIILSHYNDENN
jgi:response regulator of citrate/malate metabolism